jgi:hypothetical protein
MINGQSRMVPTVQVRNDHKQALFFFPGFLLAGH